MEDEEGTSPPPSSDGLNRIHTTHHPRPVLHVRSISAIVRRVLPTVARICACTFSASTRLHPALPPPRPSAVRVPGSGMLGRLECTVRVRGS